MIWGDFEGVDSELTRIDTDLKSVDTDLDDSGHWGWKCCAPCVKNFTIKLLKVSPIIWHNTYYVTYWLPQTLVRICIESVQKIILIFKLKESDNNSHYHYTIHPSINPSYPSNSIHPITTKLITTIIYLTDNDSHSQLIPLITIITTIYIVRYLSN